MSWSPLFFFAWAIKNASVKNTHNAIERYEEVVNLVEKPSNTYLINTGVYVIEPELLSKIPEDTYIHITEIIEKCIRDKAKIGTYIIEDNDWMDMGQLDEMEKMKEKLGVI